MNGFMVFGKAIVTGDRFHPVISVDGLLARTGADVVVYDNFSSGQRLFTAPRKNPP
jgi:hypothetical protein